MRDQLFESIVINKKRIDWEICSGIARGVQKYTKVRTIGAEYVGDDTIVEFSIQQNNKRDVELTLKGEEIRVRDGQSVSIIWGCTAGRRRELILINHSDNNRLYWVDNPYSFFDNLRIFSYLPLVFSFIVMVFSFPAVVMCGYLGWLSMPIVFSLLELASTFFTISPIILLIISMIYVYRVISAWDMIQDRILEAEKQLRY
jgi:uncharacterized membrane protein (DUF485 family)